MTGTVCVAGGETVVGDGDGSGGGDKKTGGHLSEAESEKSWKLIVLPGIERVFAFQVRVESRGATSNVFSSQRQVKFQCKSSGERGGPRGQPAPRVWPVRRVGLLLRQRRRLHRIQLLHRDRRGRRRARGVRHDRAQTGV